MFIHDDILKIYAELQALPSQGYPAVGDVVIMWEYDGNHSLALVVGKGPIYDYDIVLLWDNGERAEASWHPDDDRILLSMSHAR